MNNDRAQQEVQDALAAAGPDDIGGRGNGPINIGPAMPRLYELVMPRLYELVIRIPVFEHPDGRKIGEAQTVLPDPAPGAPSAVTATPRKDLAAAVAAVREFAQANDVTIIED